MTRFIKEFWWFIAAIIILPFLFKIPAFISWMDFSNSDSAANAINGFTTPIIGFTSVILLYKAFQKQNEANKQQREIFEEGLKNERKRIDDLENKERDEFLETCEVNIKIYKLISTQLLKYFEETGKIINEFSINEQNKTLCINPLIQQVNNDYSYFKKLNFVDLYKSASLIMPNKFTYWEYDFMKSVGTIEFYNEIVTTFYKEAFERTNEKHEKLSNIAEEINILLPICKSSKYSRFINFAVLTDIFNSIENYNEQKIKGTDFGRFNEEFLKVSIKGLKHYAIRNETDEEYDHLLNSLNSLSKKITNLKLVFLHYSQSYKDIYENKFLNNNLLLKIKTVIDNL